VLQIAADEGPEPYRVRGDLCHPANAVGHLHVERNKINT
jgi:hypothetical protein